MADEADGAFPDDHPLSGIGAPERLRHALETIDDVNAARAARRQVADELRRAIDELMTTAAPNAALDEAAELVARAVELLGHQPKGRKYEGVAEGSIGGDARAFVDFSPLFGRANPLAPSIDVTATDDRIVAVGTFGDAYEGPPGCLHGGFVAALFDEVLGLAQSFTGRPGMTGRLTIHYRSPTPLHRPIRFEGWVDRVEGRKILARGTLHDTDRLCAEAEGLFISVDPALFARMQAERDGRAPQG